MDLLVLFILHSTNANQSRRGAERVLKLKVRTGLIQETLLQKTFRDFAQVGLLAILIIEREKRQQLNILHIHYAKTVHLHYFNNGTISSMLFLQVMRGYFSSILALAQSLLRSPDPCMVAFGGHMYQHSFTAFDSYCQQVGLRFSFWRHVLGINVILLVSVLLCLVFYRKWWALW